MSDVRGRESGDRKRLFLLKEIPENFIDVFSMTNVMDPDHMVLVANFINNPKPSHSQRIITGKLSFKTLTHVWILFYT